MNAHMLLAIVCIIALVATSGVTSFSSTHTKIRQPISKIRRYVVADAEQQDQLSPSPYDSQSNDSIRNVKSTAWTPTRNGGFLPNIPRNQSEAYSKHRPARTRASDEMIREELSKLGRITLGNQGLARAVNTKPLPVQDITTLEEFRTVVARNSQRQIGLDRTTTICCVRFYAPWCRACKAMEPSYQQLARQFINMQESSPLTDSSSRVKVKFFQVALTESNTQWIVSDEGLGVPRVPYGHIYYADAGLVEECSLNRSNFSNFRRKLQTYVDGCCRLEDSDMECPSPLPSTPTTSSFE